LRDALAWALAESTGEIEIDLHTVTILDHTAIGVIVAGHNAAQRAGRRLFISHPPRFASTFGIWPNAWTTSLPADSSRECHATGRWRVPVLAPDRPGWTDHRQRRRPVSLEVSPRPPAAIMRR
jgi:STAS domain